MLSETEPAGGDVGATVRSVPSLVRLVPDLVRPQGLAPILAEQGALVVVQVLHGFPRIWNVEGNVAEEIVVPRSVPSRPSSTSLCAKTLPA